jgi:hypothetical protein
MYREFLPMKESHFRRSSRGKETDGGHARPMSRLRISGLVVAISICSGSHYNTRRGRQWHYLPHRLSSTHGAVVTVRFAVQATPNDITSFLGTYKATIIGEPQGVGFYRVRVSDAKSQDDLSKLVARMAQEKIVDFIAVQQ